MSVRERFIEETLQQEGARLIKHQGAEIRSVTQEHHGRLLRDRHISVRDSILTFTHTDYERFLDLRRIHRGGHRIKRKARHIHNRFVFGAYAAIARRLMYGLTEEVASDIRRSILR